MSDHRNQPGLVPKVWLIRAGWALFAIAFIFWLLGMYLSPTAVARANVTMMPMFRIKMTYAAAAIQIVAALAAMPLLAPFRLNRRRSRPMRDWSLRLFLLVIAITGLFHFVLLHRMGV